MKRSRWIWLVLLAWVVALLFSHSIPTFAIEGTSYTYTISIDQSKYIPTLDAYLPAGSYLADAGLNNPADLFLYGRDLYIADSGNHRILVYDLDTGTILTFGEEKLTMPTGVAVGPDGSVYVADYGAEQVVIFAPDYTISAYLNRPTEPYYGNSPYKPQKVGLDRYGNLFVISEGTHEGILQIDKNGNFNGFFGANKTKDLSLVEWFQYTFYTDEQKARMAFHTPPNIVSIDVADNNMLISVTQNDKKNGIKKLNMAGVNVWNVELDGKDNYVDAVAAPDGRVYALASDGLVDEFADDGGLLLSFGGTAINVDRNGLIAVASAIEIDEDGNLYILDKERGVFQVWFPTEYAKLLHQAESDFSAGHYEDSYDKWSRIMTMNPMAYRSYYGCARALFQLQNYKEAAELYKTIEHGVGYSNSFWEIRSAWMRTHMEQIIIAIVLFAMIRTILHFLEKRFGWAEELGERHRLACQKHPLLKALTSDVGYFLHHPIDGVYYVKTGERGTVSAATILYVSALAVRLICQGLTSFVFGGGYSWYNDPVAILLISVVPAVLFIIGSYLISSISDGEGTLRSIYISFAYSLSAYLLFWPILTALTHVFTLTEIFICQMLSVLIVGYTAIMIFISIKEAHVYNLRKTISNILLTLFFMVVMVLAAIILYIIWRELLSFVSEVLEEVIYRAIS